MRADLKYDLESHLAPLEKASKKKPAEQIPEDKLKPLAEILLDLPGSGSSVRSAGNKPIQMLVMLPENYSRDRKHPVIVHFGSRLGKPQDAKTWFDYITVKQNFIVVGLDFPYEANSDKGGRWFQHDMNYETAIYGLSVLETSTKIDRSGIVLSGNDSGAHSLTDGLPCQNAKYFCAFCPITGGSMHWWNESIPANAKKPMLFICGEKDDYGPRNGFKCNDLVNECVNFMKKGGCKNVEIFIEEGVAHVWTPLAHPVQQNWLYNKIPAFSKYKDWAMAVADESKPRQLRALNAKWLAEDSWFEYPFDESLRAAVEKFKAEEAKDAK